MKRFLSISLTMLLALVMTYAGSGINAYSFCCEDCHTFGIEAIAENKCCDLHHNEHDANQNVLNDAACESEHHTCSLDRLVIDLQEITNERNPLQSFAKQLDVCVLTIHYKQSNVEQDETTAGYISTTQKPPNLSKNTYFSLLETLII